MCVCVISGSLKVLAHNIGVSSRYVGVIYSADVSREPSCQEAQPVVPHLKALMCGHMLVQAGPTAGAISDLLNVALLSVIAISFCSSFW